MEYSTEQILQHCRLCPNDVRRTNSSSRYVCFKCDYHSPYSVTMRRHIRAHIGDLPFGCNYCNYRSNQKANLQSHIYYKHRAEGVDEIVLSENCEKTSEYSIPVKRITLRALPSMKLIQGKLLSVFNSHVMD